ncbi:hypothetical protein OC835_007743, partial [Tilletia horrida]
MKFALLSILALFAASATGAPHPQPAPSARPLAIQDQDGLSPPRLNETDRSSNANCTRLTIPVPVNVTQLSFDTTALGVVPEANQTRLTDIFVEYLTSPQNFTQAYANGTHVVDRTFNISGVLCEPTNATANGAIQVLIHGVGADASYWNIRSDEYDLPEEEYSYVYQAHKAGYSTFRYDRLGTGQSERPIDGYNDVQANTEVAILEQLVE